jgi:hypothetical protein
MFQKNYIIKVFERLINRIGVNFGERYPRSKINQAVATRAKLAP